MQSGSRSHAGPENCLANGKFPAKGAKVPFGTTVTNKIKLEPVFSFNKLFQLVHCLDGIDVCK